MGIANYESAIKKLFPEGDYWDAQFADANSDVSLFCKAKLPELIRFRERMDVLQSESVIEKTEELIADWERVLLGTVNQGLDINRRRLLLKSKRDVKLNRGELQKIAAMLGLSIGSVVFPYRPAFFGFSKFAQERHGSFAAFSVVRISSTEAGFEERHREAIITELEKHTFTRMRFAQNRMAYYPIDKMRDIIYHAIRRGCFGYGRLAHNRLAAFPIDEARRVALDRLDAKRITKVFFGQSRLEFFSRRFDPAIVSAQNFFGGTVALLLEAADFYRRFTRVLLEEYFRCEKPYYEFEKAIREKLLANQIAIFYYEGD